MHSRPPCLVQLGPDQPTMMLAFPRGSWRRGPVHSTPPRSCPCWQQAAPLSHVSQQGALSGVTELLMVAFESPLTPTDLSPVTPSPVSTPEGCMVNVRGSPSVSAQEWVFRNGIRLLAPWLRFGAAPLLTGARVSLLSVEWGRPARCPCKTHARVDGKSWPFQGVSGPSLTPPVPEPSRAPQHRIVAERERFRRSLILLCSFSWKLGREHSHARAPG